MATGGAVIPGTAEAAAGEGAAAGLAVGGCARAWASALLAALPAVNAAARASAYAVGADRMDRMARWRARSEPPCDASRRQTSAPLHSAAAVTTLAFASGTLEIRDPPLGFALPPACAWDERTNCHRAPASSYAEIVRALVVGKVAYEDTARRYTELASG